MSTRLIIERKGTGLNWEIVSYMTDDLEVAILTLGFMREEEQKKFYKGKFRLVRETREILAE